MRSLADRRQELAGPAARGGPLDDLVRGAAPLHPLLRAGEDEESVAVLVLAKERIEFVVLIGCQLARQLQVDDASLRCPVVEGALDGRDALRWSERDREAPHVVASGREQLVAADDRSLDLEQPRGAAVVALHILGRGGTRHEDRLLPRSTVHRRWPMDMAEQPEVESAGFELRARHVEVAPLAVETEPLEVAVGDADMQATGREPFGGAHPADGMPLGGLRGAGAGEEADALTTDLEVDGGRFKQEVGGRGQGSERIERAVELSPQRVRVVAG